MLGFFIYSVAIAPCDWNCAIAQGSTFSSQEAIAIACGINIF